jgi:hypothetical protein
LQGPQLDDYLPMLILHCSMSPGGLCQVNSRTYSVVSWPKDHVVDPRARILEMQAPLCLFLELGNHLPHNICLEDFSRQARKHKLSSRRHQSTASRIATSVWQATGNHIPSCRGPCSGVPTIVKHNSDSLMHKRVSSLSRPSHYPSASSHC